MRGGRAGTYLKETGRSAALTKSDANASVVTFFSLEKFADAIRRLCFGGRLRDLWIINASISNNNAVINYLNSVTLVCTSVYQLVNLIEFEIIKTFFNFITNSDIAI